MVLPAATATLRITAVHGGRADAGLAMGTTTITTFTTRPVRPVVFA